jgi:hypothetical protein
MLALLKHWGSECCRSRSRCDNVLRTNWSSVKSYLVWIIVEDTNERYTCLFCIISVYDVYNTSANLSSHSKIAPKSYLTSDIVHRYLDI